MQIPTLHPLRRTRDFGQTISDTIQFLKAHWKNLLVLYLVFVVPFLLVGTLLGAGSFSVFFSQIGAGISKIENPFSLITPIFLIAILLYFTSTMAYITIVNLYMKLFEENGGIPPTLSETGSKFIGKFLSNIGYMLLVIAGFFMMAFLAIIPILGILVFMVGIFYVMICLSILFPANTIENNPFPQSFSRMFYLIRNNWWFTFGMVIMLGLIYYFFAAIIGLIVNMIFGLGEINFLDAKAGLSNLNKKYFLITGLSAVIQQVFYLIIHVGLGIHYFSLREEKDGSGLEARLDQLGAGGGDHGHIEEQY
jgi:hypothetical protein